MGDRTRRMVALRTYGALERAKHEALTDNRRSLGIPSSL